MAGRPYYISSVTEILLCVLLTTCSVQSVVYEPIQWSPHNPKFKFTKDQFVKGVSYYRQSVLLHSKISFMCPNPRTIFGKMQNQIANELVNENLWMVDKSSFDKCSVDRGKAKLLLRCQWEPGRLQYKDVIFQIYSGSVNGLQFVRGQEYYFIATSNGLRSSLNNTSGGHCRDPKNGVSMRVVFYICRNASECNTTTEGGCGATGTPPETTVERPPRVDQRPDCNTTSLCGRGSTDTKAHKIAPSVPLVPKQPATGACSCDDCNITLLCGRGSAATKARKTAPSVPLVPKQPLSGACSCDDVKIAFGVVFTVSLLVNIILLVRYCRKPSRMKSQDEEDNAGILNLIMNKISMLQPQNNLNSGFEPEGMEEKSLPAMDKKNSTSKATTNNKSLTHV